MMQERECKCQDCDKEMICSPFAGKWLCNDCWHSARQKTPPYRVRLIRDEETRAEYGDVFVGIWRGPCCVFTQAEAVHDAAERNLKNEREGTSERWEAVPATSWAGERIAHPGYMAKRRGEVLASLPEEERKRYE